jgi:hypothetical protein
MMERAKQFFLAVGLLVVPYMLVNRLLLLLQLNEEGNLDTATTESKRYRIGTTKYRKVNYLSLPERLDLRRSSGDFIISGAEFEGGFHLFHFCFRL